MPGRQGAPSSIDADDIESRISRLEDIVEHQSDVIENQQETIEEQRELVETQSTKIDVLEEKLENRPSVEMRTEEDGTKEISDIWIGGLPFGIAVDKNTNRHQEVSKFLFGEPYGADAVRQITDTEGTLDDRIDTDTGTLKANVRDKMLRAHRHWFDIEAGRADELKMGERRAGRLFGAIWDRARGEANKVDASSNSYSISSSMVVDVLEDAGEMTQSGKSKTASRAMAAVEEYTRLPDTDDSLVRFDQSAGTNYLVADKAKMNEYLAEIQDAATDEDSDTDVRTEADAESKASLTQEADDTFAAMEAAHTDGGSDNI